MTTDVEAILAGVDLVAVVEQRVDLVKKGHDFYGLCPFHAESTPSFTVNAPKQWYHCFGCGAHGDAIDFLRELDGLSFKQAVAALGGLEKSAPRRVNGTEHAMPVPWRHQLPPADKPIPEELLVLRGLGAPIMKWAYRDAAGATIGWVCRYPDPDKPDRKQIRTFSWGSAGDDAAPHWACRRFARPTPLYGLDRLAAQPDRQVILLEGEGKADAAGRLLLGLVAMSWLGGADGVRHADFAPLTGRNVVLIPDNDEPGREAVKWLREHLIGRRCGVKVIEPEAERAKGWNLDDAEREHWTQEQTKDWCRARLKVTLVPDAKPKPAPPPPGPIGRPRDEGPEQLAREQLAAKQLSDLDLADRFVRAEGDDWRYVAEWGRWLHWEEDTWRDERTDLVKHAVADLLRQSTLWPETQLLSMAAQRQLCGSRTINAVAAVAGADRRIAATAEQWDTDPWLLGVPGGAVDLREGKLVECMREDHISRRCTVAPAPGEPTRWLAHLNLVQQGNQNVIGFLKRFCGYALTGSVDEHALAFFYGTGRNGKSIVLGTLDRILGDYSYVAPVQLMMESKTERHAVELAMLRGKRLVVCSEPPKGSRWDDGRIRWLTGGEKITARMLNENPQTFPPTHKLFIMGNHKPVLRAVDEAIKARFNMIDFSYTIPEADRISNFADLLKEEWPQILQWMIDGCLEWQRIGLGRPAEVKAATEAYLSDEDMIGTFIAECCEEGEKLSDPVATVYRAYSKWCEGGGERPTSKRAFVNALYERPAIRRKGSATARLVVGLQVLDGWKQS